MPSLYDVLVDAGCEVEGYESDMYVRACPTSARILTELSQETGLRVWAFHDKEGTLWHDIPLMYEPFWRMQLKH